MITIRNLSKAYRKRRILEKIDLDIPERSLFALLGPNGSGKTTLIKSILGTVTPASGTDIVLQSRYRFGSQDFKRRVGYMPQFPYFPPHLKVKELIRLFEKLRQTAGIYRDDLIRELGIDRYWSQAIGELSGGMVQRVNILQCFAFDALLYILDEPASGLDPHGSYYLKELMRRKRGEGRTIIFTSHVMAEVEELADTMALLIEGRIYTITSPARMKAEKKAATLEEALYKFWGVVMNEGGRIA